MTAEEVLRAVTALGFIEAEFVLKRVGPRRLITPDVYDPDLLTAVRWLQEHLPFSDEYLAQSIGASTELFSEWKTGAPTLTDSQMQRLENFH